MLIGNKCDMDDKRLISEERGKNVATENGIKFFETSAKDNINIEQAFITLAEDILNKQSPNHEDKPPGGGTVNVGQSTSQKSSCCSGQFKI
jgi:GTPase SAR1 family protein